MAPVVCICTRLIENEEPDDGISRAQPNGVHWRSLRPTMKTSNNGGCENPGMIYAGAMFMGSCRLVQKSCAVCIWSADLFIIIQYPTCTWSFIPSPVGFGAYIGVGEIQQESITNTT